MAGAPVPLRELGPIGPPIRSGGQGSIHELADHPGWLLKRYLEGVAVDVDGLVELVRWREQLREADRRMVEGRTAWPVKVVASGDDVGVVIRHAPARFMHLVEGERGPRDLQFAYCESARWASVEPVTPRGALTITYRVAQLLDLLHRTGAVYGDLSHTNVLWSQSGSRPHVYLIDCDSAWVTTSPRALAASQTDMWRDPWPTDGSADGERRRDLYKLALLFLRLYYRSQLDLTSTITKLTLRRDPPISRRVLQLVNDGLAAEPGRRPAADEWLRPLVALERTLKAQGVG